uniref:Ribosomal protein S16 n=1 Tax=Leptochilus hemionitideus TaxID=493391 RepID=A0A3G5CV39_9MONI|nr:ribosomal protein S16 [Leptochilus hemionitideus]AYW16759.1 ribosomal protein S16 [Leptochilus hemionitideus]
MVKPRLKRCDRKQRLLTNQLQLIPNFGESGIDAFRRLVPTTPINKIAKPNWISIPSLLHLNKQLNRQRLLATFREGQGCLNKSELTSNQNLNF